MKTKCIDMLIELLMNEQIFKISNLVENVISILVRITNSIYVQVAAPKDPKLAKQNQKQDLTVPALADISLTIKEHLLKKIHLKKLLIIHYRLQDRKENNEDLNRKFELILINLTFI